LHLAFADLQMPNARMSCGMCGFRLKPIDSTRTAHPYYI
jgi:hypothetical protein